MAGKPEVERPLGGPRPRWQDIIMLGIREICLGCGLHSSGSRQRAVADSCEYSSETSRSIKFWEFEANVFSSRRTLPHGFM
jgi:hypothetical protein